MAGAVAGALVSSAGEGSKAVLSLRVARLAGPEENAKTGETNQERNMWYVPVAYPPKMVWKGARRLTRACGISSVRPSPKREVLGFYGEVAVHVTLGTA